MEFSLTSFISSSIAITILIGVLLIIMKKDAILSRFGLNCIYFLATLILLRGFLPFDFYAINLTKSIYSYKILPKLNDIMNHPLIENDILSITPYQIIFIIWFLGVCFCLLRLIYAYYHSKKIILSLPKITDTNISFSCQKALYTVFPKKKPSLNLVYSDTHTSPAIWGIQAPYILLPPIEYTADELYYILIHELFHLKRKD